MKFETRGSMRKADSRQGTAQNAHCWVLWLTISGVLLAGAPLSHGNALEQASYSIRQHVYARGGQDPGFSTNLTTLAGQLRNSLSGHYYDTSSSRDSTITNYSPQSCWSVSAVYWPGGRPLDPIVFTTEELPLTNPSSGQVVEATARLSDVVWHSYAEVEKANDILFIDEVHQLPLHVEEVLYGPMGGDLVIQIAQAGYSDLMKSIGMHGKASMIKVEIQPFTLIGATTLAGHVSAPLRSRFNQVLQLEPYSVSDLRQIVSNAGKAMGFPLPQDVAHEIAARSRSTARTAMSNLKWFIEYSTATGDEPSMRSVHEAFELKGIDRHGLNTLDHSYLRALFTYAFGAKDIWGTE